jgi:hypothetical protein
MTRMVQNIQSVPSRYGTDVGNIRLFMHSLIADRHFSNMMIQVLYLENLTL